MKNNRLIWIAITLVAGFVSLVVADAGGQSPNPRKRKPEQPIVDPAPEPEPLPVVCSGTFTLALNGSTATLPVGTNTPIYPTVDVSGLVSCDGQYVFLKDQDGCAGSAILTGDQSMVTSPNKRGRPISCYIANDQCEFLDLSFYWPDLQSPVTYTACVDGLQSNAVTVTNDVPAAGLSYQWSRSFGSTGALITPEYVAVDPGDNILLSGKYNGSPDFGDGPLVSGTNNIFLAKFNPDGTQTLWSMGFDDGQSGATLVSGGTASDSAGNIYLTGYFRYATDFGGISLTPISGYDMFLVKIDPAGSVLWARKYGSSGNQYPRAIASNLNDEILVGGKFAGAANFGGSALSNNGADDVFLAKFDSDGNHVWSVNFGSSNSDDLLDVTVEGSTVAIVGFYKAAGADFGGAPLSFQGFEDIVVAKYQDNGSSLSHRFSRGFGSSGSDKGYAVAIDPASGDIAVTGTFDAAINFGGPTTYPDTDGGVDVFLLKLDASGNWIGDQGFGGSGTYSIVSRDVIIDGQGDVIMTGDTSISVDFGGGTLTGGSQDIFVAEFDLNLAQHLWSGRFGGLLGGDVGRAMVLNHAGDLLVAGDFWTSVNFGGPTHTGIGTTDAFLAAFGTD